MKSSRSAFTLIELLIVIAILGILMALLFPAVGAAIDNARRASAKNDCVQIATAITAYETEYGRLPSTNANGPLPTEVLGALMGSNSSSLNPRLIVFLEVQTARKGKGGLGAGGTYVDPWGNAYQVAFDGDYNNKVNAGTNGTEIMKKVAVWNVPTGSQSEVKRRAVNSWE
jgi:prepilin-type N-terminal cleavage/methylation domain-containing protein